MFTLYFDIDGVANRTPQLGGLAPHVEPECFRYLQILFKRTKLAGGEIRCISFHRNNRAVLKTLGLDYPSAGGHCAKKCELVDADKPHLIIDDDASQYVKMCNLYLIDGKRGITDIDFCNLMMLLRITAK